MRIGAATATVIHRQLARFAMLVYATANAGASAATAGNAPTALPPGFVAETIASRLNAATAIAPSPDGRIFIAEQTGRVLVWKDGAVLAQPVLEVDVDDYWERGLVGLALHPDFPRPPQLFVLYVTDRPFRRHVLSRYILRGDIADPSTALMLIDGDDHATIKQNHPGGHQGGLLRFGHDGKLYASIGELTGGQPAQRFDTLHGKILRVNPDGSIPEDNPFVSHTTGKYRAIYAYGVRNSFGIAVQPPADGGRMFFTDVGGTAFDEVNELFPAGNYGWPQTEGPTDAAGVIGPLFAYSQLVGKSVCGGFFYPRIVTPQSGAKPFPEKWRGKFFFADFSRHWIKALDPANPASVVTFGLGFDRPVAIEAAADGSLLVLNRGSIWRDGQKFVPNKGFIQRIRYRGEDPSAGADSRSSDIATAGFPERLSDAGIFAELPELRPREGFEAFALNAPVWLPGMTARRWIALPPCGTIRFSADAAWTFPAGTIVMQHFDVAPIAGSAAAARPFETHVYWLRGATSHRAAAYRWNATGADAALVKESEVVPLVSDRAGSGSWYSPGADDALDAENAIAGFVLQLNTRQLNCIAPENESENQLARWNRLRRFESPGLAAPPEKLPRLAAIADTSAALELRARSYLDANCASCHRPGGASRSAFDARFGTPLAEQHLIGEPPQAGDLGVAGARLIVPGDPSRSLLYLRMNRADVFRMPPIAVHAELSPALSVIEEWIRSLRPAELSHP